MVSLTSDKCESSLTRKKMKIPSKQKLTLPNPNQRQDWESVIENVVKSVDNNEELKNSLQKIGKAEKIPRKWNRIDRSTFLTFLNNISGYQVNPNIDERSFELISKVFKERHEKKGNNDNQIKATKRKSEIHSISGNKKIRKDIEENGSKKKEASFKEKKMAVKLSKKPKKSRDQEKRQKERGIWKENIQSMIPEAGNNKELVYDLQRVSSAPNIPCKIKWEKLNRHIFMAFLMNIPSYSVNPTTSDELWRLVSKALKKSKEKKKIQTPIKSVKVPKIEIRKQVWVALSKNVILENKDSKLNSYLETISKTEKFPKHLNKLNQLIFMRFLKTVPGYTTNPEIDEKIWKLFSKALIERSKSIALNAKAINEEVIETKTEDSNSKKEGNKKKKKLQVEESKSQVNEITSNQAYDTLNPVKQSTKVKWSSIGKQILGNQEDSKLSLKKFQKRIVKEYRKQTGESGDNESVEALWSKCLKKLSKNSKFQFVDDEIKLVL